MNMIEKLDQKYYIPSDREAGQSEPSGPYLFLNIAEGTNDQELAKDYIFLSRLLHAAEWFKKYQQSEGTNEQDDFNRKVDLTLNFMKNYLGWDQLIGNDSTQHPQDQFDREFGIIKTDENTILVGEEKARDIRINLEAHVHDTKNAIFGILETFRFKKNSDLLILQIQAAFETGSLFPVQRLSEKPQFVEVDSAKILDIFHRVKLDKGFDELRLPSKDQLANNRDVVLAHPVLLRDLLINSVNNARVSFEKLFNIEEGSSDTLSVNVEVGERIVIGKKYLEIIIVDNGAGLPNEVGELTFDTPADHNHEERAKGMLGIGLHNFNQVMSEAEIVLTNRTDTDANGDPVRGAELRVRIPVVSDEELSEI